MTNLFIRNHSLNLSVRGRERICFESFHFSDLGLSFLKSVRAFSSSAHFTCTILEDIPIEIRIYDEGIYLKAIVGFCEARDFGGLQSFIYAIFCSEIIKLNNPIELITLSWFLRSTQSDMRYLPKWQEKWQEAPNLP